MKAKSILSVILAVWMFSSNLSYAADSNTFNLGLFVGDSYATNNVRLAFGHFDIGWSDLASVYAGTRKWLDNYYAGFGVATTGGIYGMVGYEWRIIPWAGLSFEFDGSTNYSGVTAGRVYLGVVAGW